MIVSCCIDSSSLTTKFDTLLMILLRFIAVIILCGVFLLGMFLSNLVVGANAGATANSAVIGESLSQCRINIC